MNLLAAILLAAVATAEQAPVGKTARITSDSTYYDRKEGFACFRGNVFVDDGEYQLHADRAYVFMDGTNELKRIVALGNVAMTNGTKRAYGAKASYYHEPGMVVLYAGEGEVAKVLEEVPGQDPRVVKGQKIRFWTKQEQVEVLQSEISATTEGGLNGLKGMMGK